MEAHHNPLRCLPSATRIFTVIPNNMQTESLIVVWWIKCFDLHLNVKGVYKQVRHFHAALTFYSYFLLLLIKKGPIAFEANPGTISQMAAHAVVLETSLHFCVSIVTLPLVTICCTISKNHDRFLPASSDIPYFFTWVHLDAAALVCKWRTVVQGLYWFIFDFLCLYQAVCCRMSLSSPLHRPYNCWWETI